MELLERHLGLVEGPTDVYVYSNDDAWACAVYNGMALANLLGRPERPAGTGRVLT